jgi:hypothetical protein
VASVRADLVFRPPLIVRRGSMAQSGDEPPWLAGRVVRQVRSPPPRASRRDDRRLTAASSKTAHRGRIAIGTRRDLAAQHHSTLADMTPGVGPPAGRPNPAGTTAPLPPGRPAATAIGSIDTSYPWHCGKQYTIGQPAVGTLAAGNGAARPGRQRCRRAAEGTAGPAWRQSTRPPLGLVIQESERVVHRKPGYPGRCPRPMMMRLHALRISPRVVTQD